MLTHIGIYDLGICLALGVLEVPRISVLERETNLPMRAYPGTRLDSAREMSFDGKERLREYEVR